MNEMRSLTALVIVVLAVALASPALAVPEAPRLHTYVRFLVGHPEATGDTGVLVVPGPVVLTGGQEAERQALDVLRVIKEMKESLRLADLQPVGFAGLLLTVGKEELAPSTPGGPTVHVTLLGYDDTAATYQIRLTQDDTPPTEAKITVRRDGRGLLGGRDGGAAPYFVLMVEPEPPLPAAPNLLPKDAVPPKIISRVAPQYPPDARQAKLEGVVTLTATIAKDGSVRALRPVRSEPLGLTEAAIKAVSQWRYEPARDAAGNPIESAFYVTMSFTLPRDKVSAQGAGGILRAPVVPVPRLPPALVLPEGTLVAIGCGPAWNAAKPESSFLPVSFRTKGGRATYCIPVPENVVRFFTWTCAAPVRDAQGTTFCTPVETSGPRKGQWRPEFMEQAEKTAEKLHVTLIAEISQTPPHGGGMMREKGGQPYPNPSIHP